MCAESAPEMGRGAVQEMDGLIARGAEPGRLVLVPTEFVARKSSVNARVGTSSGFLRESYGALRSRSAKEGGTQSQSGA